MSSRIIGVERSPLVRALGLVERFGYEKSDVVVGTMPNLVEHVHKVSGSKIRVEHIGVGIDPELGDFIKTQAPEPLGPKFRICYAGSIGRANALHHALRVVESFRGDSIVFDLYGKGDLLEELKKQYSHCPAIVFHGVLPRAELFENLASADVLYVSMDDSEIWRFGQSNHKILEYMALGRPIIASYSGFPSMINEARCGIFVGVGDDVGLRNAIVKMKKMSPNERNEMGLKGKNWVLQNRTYERLAKRYLQIMDPDYD